MQIKEKNLLVSICDLTMHRLWQARKPNVKNMASCFPNIENDT